MGIQMRYKIGLKRTVNKINMKQALLNMHSDKQLQSQTKMLRKIDVAMLSFKMKLLKALATTNASPSPPLNKKTMLKFGWIISDQD